MKFVFELVEFVFRYLFNFFILISGTYLFSRIYDDYWWDRYVQKYILDHPYDEVLNILSSCVFTFIIVVFLLTLFQDKNNYLEKELKKLKSKDTNDNEEQEKIEKELKAIKTEFANYKNKQQDVDYQFDRETARQVRRAESLQNVFLDGLVKQMEIQGGHDEKLLQSLHQIQNRFDNHVQSGGGNLNLDSQIDQLARELKGY